MMKALVSILFLTLATISASFAEPVKIGLASEPYPPASYQDENEQWTGWEVGLMKALCLEAKLDCEFVPVPWTSIFAELNASKVDAIISSIIITQERLELVDFTDSYCGSAASSVVVAAKSSSIDGTLASFKDKSVGAQTATTHANYIDKYFEGVAAKIQKFDVQSDAFRAISTGELDAVLASPDDIGTFLSSEAGQTCCELKGGVEPDTLIFGDGIGIGVRKYDVELKTKLNKAIQAIKSDNRFSDALKPFTDPNSC